MSATANTEAKSFDLKGFISKFAVFTAAAGGGAIPLVVIGVVASAIAVYFYVRVIMLMFFTEPPDDAPDVLPPGSMTLVVIALCLSVTFVHLPDRTL